eukprot:sb/3470875/
MNTYDMLYPSPSPSLKEAERLMNISLTKINFASQHDLPLRRSLLIASVLNRAQRAAADAIASLDCTVAHHHQRAVENSGLVTVNSDMEMHILGNDLLSEILCDRPGEFYGAEECGDNLRKRPRDLPVPARTTTTTSPLPTCSSTSSSSGMSELHDSKRLKEDGDEWPGASSSSSAAPVYSDLWALGNIWTTPVMC